MRSGNLALGPGFAFIINGGHSLIGGGDHMRNVDTTAWIIPIYESPKYVHGRTRLPTLCFRTTRSICATLHAQSFSGLFEPGRIALHLFEALCGHKEQLRFIQAPGRGFAGLLQEGSAWLCHHSQQRSASLLRQGLCNKTVL